MMLHILGLGAGYPFGEGVTNVRKLVGNTWIPTVEGVDTIISENATKVQMLRTLPIGMNATPHIRNGKLFYRVYLPVSTELSIWSGNTAVWAQWFTGWVTIACEYTADNKNRYTINGVLKYSGALRSTVGIYCGAASGTYLIDTGGRGGVLPAGHEWW